MALDYTLLFTRLGSVMGVNVDAATKNFAVSQTDIDACLDNFSDNPAYAEDLSAIRGPSQYALSQPIFQACQRAASKTLIEQINDELFPLAPKTELAALEALIDAMVDDSKSIQSSAVTSTMTAGASNNGDGETAESVALTASIDRQNVHAETIVFTCITDRAAGLLYSGNEIWTFNGEAAVPRWSDEWPLGSGVSGTIRTCSADRSSGENGPNKNAVIGGGFEAFYSSGGGSVPTYFEAVSGAALMASTTDSMRGDYGVQITGDGSTQFSLRQKFGQESASNGSNTVLLQPNTRYLVSVGLKVGGAVTGGVVRLSLKDGAATVLGSVSVNVTSMTTSYVVASFQYLTGDSIDPDTALVLESTTAVPNTEIVRADELMVTEMAEAYPSGPLYAILAGATDFAVNDTFELAVTNDRDGVFQQEFARIFPSVMANRLVITSSGSPNISDALVTP